MKFTNKDLLPILAVLDKVGFNPVASPTSEGKLCLIIKNNKFMSYSNRVSVLSEMEGYPHLTKYILNNNVKSNAIFSRVDLQDNELTPAILELCLPSYLVCSEEVFTGLFNLGVIQQASWSKGSGTLDSKNIDESHQDYLNLSFILKEVFEFGSLTGLNKLTVNVDKSLNNVPGVSLYCETSAIEVPDSVKPLSINTDNIDFTSICNIASYSISSKHHIPESDAKELLYSWNRSPSLDKIYNRVLYSKDMTEWIKTIRVLVTNNDTKDMITSLNRWFSVKDGKIDISSGSVIKDPRFVKMKTNIESKNELTKELFVDIIFEGVKSINGRGLPTNKKDLILFFGDIAAKVSASFLTKRERKSSAYISPDIDK